MKVLEIRLWNERVGALGWDAAQGYARFQYDADFLRSGLSLSPLQVQATRKVQQFPALARSPSMAGLPGFIADSLPGQLGNQVLQAWLVARRRGLATLNPLERLALVGTRGPGALEYLPDDQAKERGVAIPLHVGELASAALKLTGANGAELTAEELELLVTTCLYAGDRPAAVVGWNPQSAQVLSGQALLPAGFEHWLLPLGSDDAMAGRIEYACTEMAYAAGINVMECRLHREGSQAWFMTRRVDRVDGNSKVHRLTFAGLVHAADEAPGACSYEQVFQAMRELRLGQEALNEMYRRMLFNICARNQADDPRSVAFLMFADGQWQLAPASVFRLASSPRGLAPQQMSCNGKRDDFTLDDLLHAARAADVKRPLLQLERVQDALARWPEFAAQAGLSEQLAARIALQHRRFIDSSQVAHAVAEGPAQGTLF